MKKHVEVNNVEDMELTDKTTKEPTMLKYRNIISVSVSTIVLLNLIWSHYYGTYRYMSVPILFLQLSVDLPFVSTDLKIHHFLGICICLAKYFFHINNYDDWHLIKSIYKTELSTFFYIFKYWLEEDNAFTKRLSHNQKCILQKINNMFFYLSFFKFRIYDCTKNIFLNTNGFQIMETYTKGLFINQFIVYFGVTGLYILNLYWFTIMTKILFKPITKSICSEKIAIITDQTFTQFSHFLNIPVVLYVYSMSPNESYIYDVMGILGLSLASYEFHKTVANIYKRLNVVVYTSDDIIEFYSADQISIHLRAFLGTVTALYYSNFNIFLIPAVYHSGSCIATLNYLYNLKQNGKDAIWEPVNEEGRKLIQFAKMVTSIPITLDILIITWHSQNNIAAIQSIIISYVCFLLLMVRPFYRFNPSAFHICLILQSYYLSKCNIR